MNVPLILVLIELKLKTLIWCKIYMLLKLFLPRNLVICIELTHMFWGCDQLSWRFSSYKKRVTKSCVGRFHIPTSDAFTTKWITISLCFSLHFVFLLYPQHSSGSWPPGCLLITPSTYVFKSLNASFELLTRLSKLPTI